MGMLVDGKWSVDTVPSGAKGPFVRPQTHFRDHVTADGSSGFPAEAGRYHIYAAYACPWAHRTLIMRKLKGLEEAISISIVDPVMGDDGWAFGDKPGCIPDSLYGSRFLREIYLRAKPDYTGRVTVPVLWDRERETIVNNESAEIMRMLDTQFGAIATRNTDFYPEPLRALIDETRDAIYPTINNGVYRAGFAGNQEAHTEAVTELFAALDHCEAVLSRQRYLCGDVITEADWCLFTTLFRFDPVYVTHFKCNLRRIVDYPNLWNYLRDLYQVPGVAGTCNLEHIKSHYFLSHETINPRRIVPLGPEIDFDAPHDRDRFARATA